MTDLNTSTGTIVVDNLYSVDFCGNLADFNVFNNASRDSHAYINVGYSKDELWARHWRSKQRIGVELTRQHGIRGAAITPPMREQVKRRHGTMVDGIGILPSHEPIEGRFDFKLVLPFYQTFSVSDTRYHTKDVSYEDAVVSSMYTLCDTAEKTVLARKPDNMAEYHPIKKLGIEVSVCHNVLDGLVIASPKTYYNLTYDLEQRMQDFALRNVCPMVFEED